MDVLPGVLVGVDAVAGRADMGFMGLGLGLRRMGLARAVRGRAVLIGDGDGGRLLAGVLVVGVLVSPFVDGVL